MHFKITGTEHANSARRTVELDAPNRAAAEKQAHLQGVDEILRVEQVVDDSAQAELAPRVRHRGEFDEGSGKAKWIAAATLVVVLVAAAIFFWTRMRAT